MRFEIYVVIRKFKDGGLTTLHGKTHEHHCCSTLSPNYLGRNGRSIRTSRRGRRTQNRGRAAYINHFTLAKIVNLDSRNDDALSQNVSDGSRMAEVAARVAKQEIENRGQTCHGSSGWAW
jgi:hypothetical protein